MVTSDNCKGQLISKCPFGIFKSPKNFVLFLPLYRDKGRNSYKIFIGFLGELKIPKGHFEIN